MTVVGNWKMHTTPQEARILLRDILRGLTHLREIHGSGPWPRVLVAPPFTSLAACQETLRDDEFAETVWAVHLAGQDVFWEAEGAYTGAISAPMLLASGCRAVVVGHSERRRIFRETDEEAVLKARAALQAGLDVFFCVGEGEDQREAGETFAVLRRQLEPLWERLPAGAQGKLAIAYEPVWAIGTGRAARPEDAEEAAQFIREDARRHGWEGDLPVLYGGSVTPENAGSFFRLPSIHGALVGGASLKAASFLGILEAAWKAAEGSL
ncbi:MAG: triose-phosphate isomerase [Clostridiales bacterium]|nr:triose-phosphate isomerase [Clostridiales bacterium]